MKTPMVDPSALVLLATIADSGSLSSAARVQDITQSALTKQLARIEQQLGVTLSTRSIRRHNLTGQDTNSELDGLVHDELAPALAKTLSLTLPTNFVPSSSGSAFGLCECGTSRSERSQIGWADRSKLPWAQHKEMTRHHELSANTPTPA